MNWVLSGGCEIADIVVLLGIFAGADRAAGQRLGVGGRTAGGIAGSGGAGGAG